MEREGAREKRNFKLDTMIVDWENYLPTNDEPTCGEGRTKAGQRLTPIQNGLIVRVRW